MTVTEIAAKIARSLKARPGQRARELAEATGLTSGQVRAGLLSLRASDMLNPPGVSQIYSLSQNGAEYCLTIGPESRQAEMF